MFINLGGPPVFKLHFFFGQLLLINRGGIIHPHLTLQTSGISQRNSLAKKKEIDGASSKV